MTTTTISTAALSDCLPALERFAMSLTGTRDQADDLVQDTVERALKKAHLFDGSNLRAWMFTICRRLFLNQIRSRKTRGIAVPVDDAPQAALSIDERQEMSMHFQDVANAFEKLPLNDRVILSLVVMEGLKYEETAELLDIPIGTVRSRLSRARARLEAMIVSDEEETGTLSAAQL